MIKEIAQKRKNEIEYSKARIEKKLQDMPNDQRAEGWRKRLSEYAESLRLVNFTIETGRKVLFKGEQSEGGVQIDPPAGQMNVGNN